MPKLKLNVVHPTNGSDISIETDSDITIGEVIFELVQNNFLASGLSYSLLIGEIGEAAAVDRDKSLRELGIEDGAVLKLRVAASAGETPSALPDMARSSVHAQYQREPQESIQIQEAEYGGIPQIDIDKLLRSKDNSDSIIAILRDYARVLSENAQWIKRHEFEYKSFCDERTKLENKLKSYERQSSEKKIAAMILTVAQIVIGLGAAFVTTSVMPSVFTIIAGVSMTAAGLWLTFKKRN